MKTIKSLKNRIALFLELFLLASAAFSLPGIKQQISDTSGEYVYYKDSTFQRESYIGFVYYDDETYAARYYAPSQKDSDKSLTEKDITIYFTIDPSKDFLELTGESIANMKDAEDIDIVNYIHDLLYEFTAQRQKISFAENAKKESFTSTGKAEILQLGGEVTIKYNSLVPLFNIESIKDSKNKVIFQIQTTGSLSSSQDKSFASFKGLQKNSTESKREFSLKKSKKVSVEFEGNKITLDENWERKMDNLWVLGNEAVLMVTNIPLPENSLYTVQSFARRILQSKNDSLISWEDVKISSKGNTTTIESLTLNSTNPDVVKEITIITDKNGESISYFLLTVFNSTFSSNEKYFYSIAESYKSE